MSLWGEGGLVLSPGPALTSVTFLYDLPLSCAPCRPDKKGSGTQGAEEQGHCSHLPASGGPAAPLSLAQGREQRPLLKAGLTSSLRGGGGGPTPVLGCNRHPPTSFLVPTCHCSLSAPPPPAMLPAFCAGDPLASQALHLQVGRAGAWSVLEPPESSWACTDPSFARLELLPPTPISGWEN